MLQSVFGDLYETPVAKTNVGQGSGPRLGSARANSDKPVSIRRPSATSAAASPVEQAVVRVKVPYSTMGVDCDVDGWPVLRGLIRALAGHAGPPWFDWFEARTAQRAPRDRLCYFDDVDQAVWHVLDFVRRLQATEQSHDDPVYLGRLVGTALSNLHTDVAATLDTLDTSDSGPSGPRPQPLTQQIRPAALSFARHTLERLVQIHFARLDAAHLTEPNWARLPLTGDDEMASQAAHATQLTQLYRALRDFAPSGWDRPVPTTTTGTTRIKRVVAANPVTDESPTMAPASTVPRRLGSSWPSGFHADHWSTSRSAQPNLEPAAQARQAVDAVISEMDRTPQSRALALRVLRVFRGLAQHTPSADAPRVVHLVADQLHHDLSSNAHGGWDDDDTVAVALNGALCRHADAASIDSLLAIGGFSVPSRTGDVDVATELTLTPVSEPPTAIPLRLLDRIHLARLTRVVSDSS